MKIEQKKWSLINGWETIYPESLAEEHNLVIVFGGKNHLENKKIIDEIKSFYKNSDYVFCSTAGEIIDNYVYDDTIVITAIKFETTKVEFSQINIKDFKDSFIAGEFLCSKIKKEGLKHVFIISDGQKVNGSQLVKGVNSKIPKGVSVTGGLAGDGKNFKTTLVGINDYPDEGNIIAIGFYGDNFKVGYGSRGGWDPFGPERIITKSKNNVLYELDGQSALNLYKQYLGEKASGLPGTGLLFPLSIRISENQEPLVRTILAINEEDQSMIFAGDMPEGAHARLMKANFDRLIIGAQTAATNSFDTIGKIKPHLAILISCVGRKLILGQRIEEEVETVRDVVGTNAIITGFYSYGEISPFNLGLNCELHNQTMTITLISEE